MSIPGRRSWTTRLRDGFRRVEPLFSSEPLNDMTLLEQKLRQLLERRGFVTVEGSAYIYTEI